MAWGDASQSLEVGQVGIHVDGNVTSTGGRQSLGGVSVGSETPLLGSRINRDSAAGHTEFVPVVVSGSRSIDDASSMLSAPQWGT